MKNTLQDPRKSPVMFAGHGSPMNAIGDNIARAGWIDLGKQLKKPEAIVAVSAHWLTHGRKVRTAADNPQINDMYGFPEELYQIHYEPAGSPELARKALELLGDGAEGDNTWGIDHGVWSVLSNMFPDADVPVVMVSVDADASPEEQYAVGQKLAALRDEGAMIFASGNVVHNLRMVDWDNAGGFDWADAFDGLIKGRLSTGDRHGVTGYSAFPDSRLAVPTTEHFFPLLTALGAAEDQDTIAVFNEYRELGSMSMTSYLFF